MTPLLAYVDLRPFVFLAGWPVFIAVVFLIGRVLRTRWRWWQLSVPASAAYALIFVFFLTGYGPFVNQKEQREFFMQWEILPEPSRGMDQAEVILTFVEFPSHRVGIFSDELANHLKNSPEQPVRVIFEVTSDYGRVRGFREIDVAGLRGLLSEWGYYSISEPQSPSPFD